MQALYHSNPVRPTWNMIPQNMYKRTYHYQLQELYIRALTDIHKTLNVHADTTRQGHTKFTWHTQTYTHTHINTIKQWHLKSIRDTQTYTQTQTSVHTHTYINTTRERHSIWYTQTYIQTQTYTQTHTRERARAHALPPHDEDTWYLPEQWKTRTRTVSSIIHFLQNLMKLK